MNKDGTQDTSFIDLFFKKAVQGPVYIIKSTVVPGTTNSLIKKYSNLDIIFSPEFLTERTAKLDIITQTRIILGGNKEITKKVRKIFEARFMNKNIIETDVNNTSREFVLKLKLEDENTLGIIIKITKGLIIPPDK